MSFITTFFKEENEIKAGINGAIEVLVKVMSAHEKNFKICENGCIALSNITANSNHSKYQNSFIFNLPSRKPDTSWKSRGNWSDTKSNDNEREKT